MDISQIISLIKSPKGCLLALIAGLITVITGILILFKGGLFPKMPALPQPTPPTPPKEKEVQIGDPVTDYLFYPNAQLITKELEISLCREMIEVEDQWRPGQTTEKAKQDLCSFKDYQNPKYYEEAQRRTAEINYFTREVDSENIANWFIKEAKLKGWEPWSKDKHPSATCPQSSPGFSLSFCKEGGCGGLQVTITPRMACSLTAGHFYQAGINIKLTVDKVLID